jgi:RHS repeat-associated protein
MRAGVRWVIVVLVFYVAALTGLASLSLATAAPAAGGSGASAGSGALAPGAAAQGDAAVLGSLVVPGVQALDGGQQLQDQAQARRTSPAAFAALARSRTAFHDLDAARAAQLAREVFPQAIVQPAGGPPQLPAGQKITSYPTDNAAQIALPGGKHGVVESSQPIALETSKGHRTAIDLGLTRAADGFKPAAAAVEVQIPKRLGAGVELSGARVSLTPVDAEGAPLGGSEGALDGASVLYANTQTDTDTVAKPTTRGFELDALLRSIDSPERLYYRVGMPAGARLVAQRGGAVGVVKGGVELAVVLPVSAEDAAGASVPAAIGASGDLLTVTVDRRGADYQYPIDVDPTIEDAGGGVAGGGSGEVDLGRTWGFYNEENPAAFVDGTYSLTSEEKGGRPELLYGVEDTISNSVGLGQQAFFYYRTQGESKIYGLTAETEYRGNGANRFENRLVIANTHTATSEAQQAWIENYGWTNTTICALAACAPGSVNSSNDKSEASYLQYVREAGPMAGGTSRMKAAGVDIVQEAGPSTSFITSEPKIYGVQNGLYAGKWVKAGHELFEVGMNAFDPGLGIMSVAWSSPGDPEWGESHDVYSGCDGVQCEECLAVGCATGPLYIGLTNQSNSNMPEGEDVLEGKVTDPVGLSATAKATVKIDNAAPYSISLSGLPPYNEIAFGYYKFKASATDGSGSVPSSGVASIAVAIDGKEVGKPNGSCSPGPCTATGEWTVNGEEYPAGKNTIVITATDAAGNVAKEEATLTIHAAESKPAGPGAVELASGAFTLGSIDAALASPGAGLAVERSFNSRRVSAGVEGPFGTQWQGLSFGGNESLTKLSSGSIVFAASSGAESLFTKEGTKFLAPPGDASMTLKEESSSTFTLTDQHGDVTTFTVPSGGSGTVFTPSAREEAEHAGAIKYTFQTTAGGVTEPTQALAPAPAGVTCTTLVKGCRALAFSYASSTTATGEAPAEWGEYKGRLAKVSVTAYNPSSKAMQTTAVAQYAYDKQGRLRAEWDPRISPALKTTYGYDTEGHVTAVTQPGQQPWLLHYGTIESDPSGGRLLSVTRPAAATAFGEGIAPADTEAPKLSTTSPTVGKEIAVSTGTWSHSALSYGYQWEHCNAAGAECALIAGAVNSVYTPRYSDEGHALVVLVTATNGGGATTAATAPSAVVPIQAFAPTYSTSFGSLGSTEGKLKSPSYIAFSEYNGPHVDVTDTGNNRVEEFEPSGKYIGTFGSAGTGAGQFKEPTGIATAKKSEGLLWVADSGNKRVQWYSYGSYYSGTTPSTGTGALGGMSVNESKGEYWTEQLVAHHGEYPIELFRTTFSGSFGYSTHFGTVGSSEGQFKEPSAVAWNGAAEDLYATDTGNNRVEALAAKGAYAFQFGKAGSGPGEFKEPKGIAVDSQGTIWVVDTGNNRVEGFSSTGKHSFMTEFGKEGTGEGQFKSPVGIAVDSSNNLYVVDSGNNRVEKWLAGKRPADPPLPAPGPPALGTSAVTTIDYGVPVSGSGAPYQLSSTETAAWAQTDNPVEATAIFPPDEPMGWPAKDYKRASVYYRDSKDRTVNTASPSGAISTTEYNTSNDVVRTLSADDRAAALKEGSKSAEVSKLLDSESTYNSEGVELQSTLGPQHTVKLASGATVEARDHKQYFYDEGAPVEGGPYRLVTKVTDGAQYSGKEEDVRTTTTSYSGQENLGWKLREPTSVTTDPAGLKLTHTIVYEASTGNVLESRTPAASGQGRLATPVYSSSAGSFGTKGGQFNEPEFDAVDASGNVWVTDSNNNRFEELSATGTFIKAVGFHVNKGGKEALEMCTAECEAGTKGSGSGQFNIPTGIAVSQSTGNVYVADNNERIQEFNSSGGFVRAFGSSGSAAEEIKAPEGLAIDSAGNVWLGDQENNRVDEFSAEGKWVKAVGFGVSNGEAKLQTCTTTCKIGLAGSGEGQFSSPVGVAFAGGNLYVVDYTNNRVQEMTTAGAYVAQLGSHGTGNGQFNGPRGIAVEPITGDLYVSDTYNSRLEAFTPAGGFLFTFSTSGTEGKDVQAPLGLAVSAAGTLYISDMGNNRVDIWKTGGGGAHATQTIYYTTAANGTYPACGEHAEWAGMPCETGPVQQPETGGVPNLPVTTTTYNIWDEPETSVETVGTTTRTKTSTYDAAGRLEKSAVSSTVGTALPTVSYEYNKETGALKAQSTTAEGKTETISSVLNSLGEMTSYTDAAENTSTYTYDIDGRVEKVNDGKGTQTYTYDPTTGFPTKLVDSVAGTFTGSYDVEGALLTEGYPNGMNANYTYNQAGAPTSLEYVKTTHCTTGCTWFSDKVVPSIHGQWLEQTSSLSKQAYTYDAAGRLTQVQNTPAGLGCTTRLYAYDEDTNRTSLTTRAPGSKGECTTTGGTIESHAYDSADRLIDSGTAYNTFGDITAVPAADAGGTELTSGFYSDNQLQSETQNGQTIGYNLDPAGRTLETVATGKRNSVITAHYAGPGSTPAWTVGTSGEWTRNISGLSGFAAVQSNAETPVLQLTNLHGDIVATAYLSETATGLASTADASEFGVPTTSMPPKYSWLGEDQIPTELASGVQDMGARSYVPELGRFLQPDPQSGGSANAYSYTFGDPVNSSDPSGEYTLGAPSQALIELVHQIASEGVAQQAAENAAARAEAERKAAEAEQAMEAASGPQYEGEEEWEEEWEEEGAYEYASYHPEATPARVEGHIETAVLTQGLGEASEENGSNGEGEGTTSSAVPLCQTVTEGPCASDGRFVHLRRSAFRSGGSNRVMDYNRKYPYVPAAPARQQPQAEGCFEPCGRAIPGNTPEERAFRSLTSYAMQAAQEVGETIITEGAHH